MLVSFVPRQDRTATCYSYAAVTLTLATSPTMKPWALEPTGAPFRPAQLRTSVRSWLAPSVPVPAVKTSVLSAQVVPGAAVKTALLPILNCTVHPLRMLACLASSLIRYCVPGQSVRGCAS